MMSFAIPLNCLAPSPLVSGDDRAFARFDLLDVVQIFGKDRVVRRDENRRQIRSNQRDDAVLQFRARMAFAKR